MNSSDTTTPLRIMLVDDHEILREGLRRSFEAADVEIVAEAENGSEAIKVAAEANPDLILMDLTMPILDGIGATRTITQNQPGIPIVILTMHDDVDSTRRALQAGAVGYLTKGSPFRDVLATVQAAASGETTLSAGLAQEIIGLATSEGDEEILSERHVEILQEIANGASTKQAAIALGITTKTVHNHLNAIYRRLDAQSLTHAVLGAIRLGLIDLHSAAAPD